MHPLPTRLHGLVLNYLSTGAALHFLEGNNYGLLRCYNVYLFFDNFTALLISKLYGIIDKLK
jgi:hypothetical protein